MPDDAGNHLRTESASEACRGIELGEGARALLRPGQAPRAFVESLIGAGLRLDAVRVLANALAKREAVWWALLCAREAAGPTPTAPVAASLEATERWVVEPTEASRREAMAAAEGAGFGTPAGCAGASAFWSGGSLGPPHVADIPPGEHLTARGVAGAVLMAAVALGPEKADATHDTFLARGLAVADGANRWPAPTPAGPAAPQAARAVPPPSPAPAPAPAPARPARVLDTWE